MTRHMIYIDTTYDMRQNNIFSADNDEVDDDQVTYFIIYFYLLNLFSRYCQPKDLPIVASL